MANSKRWCPAGCGKTVCRDFSISTHSVPSKKKYLKCNRCNRKFTKDEVEKHWKEGKYAK